MYTAKKETVNTNITVKKSRLKKYQDNKYYLNSGTQFEIQFNNETDSR